MKTEKIPNPQQEAVIALREGAYCIEAAAGVGKTQVIVDRVCKLVQDGADPDRILNVTFTVKASEEMRDRVQQRTGRRPTWTMNFHRLCTRLIRKYPAIGVPEGFEILSADQSETLIKRIVREVAPYADLKRTWKQAQAQIDQARRARLFDGLDSLTFEATQSTNLLAVAEAYESRIATDNKLDFDLIVYKVAWALRDNPSLRSEVGALWDWVQVDEAQDTDPVQLEIVKRICPHGNVIMVGDTDQGLYRFRGAEPRNIAYFREHFQAKTLPLELNYRSRPEILEMANAIICANPARYPKQLKPVRPSGGLVNLTEFPDTRSEADQVADRIEQAIRAGTSPEDLAVLFRVGSLSRAIESALSARKIPYRMAGALRFWDRREVRDLLAWAKVLLKRNDAEAYRRATQTPALGIGSKGWQLVTSSGHPEEGLYAHAAGKSARFFSALAQARELGTHGKALTHLLDRGGYFAYLEADAQGNREDYLQRMANVQEVLTILNDCGGVQELLNEVHLGLRGREECEGVPLVTLSTVHAAKGLEWGEVFLVGVGDGILPHAYALWEGDGPQMEEERRVMYVACTRAKDRLNLSYPVFMDHGSGMVYTPPSRFLQLVPSLLAQPFQNPKEAISA